MLQLAIVKAVLPSHASKLKMQIKVEKKNVLGDSTHYPNNKLRLSEMN